MSNKILNKVFSLPSVLVRQPSWFFNRYFFIGDAIGKMEKKPLDNNDIYIQHLMSKRSFMVCIILLILYAFSYLLASPIDFVFFAVDLSNLGQVEGVFSCLTKQAAGGILLILLPFHLLQYRYYYNPLDHNVWPWDVPKEAGTTKFLFKSILGLCICVSVMFYAADLFVVIRKFYIVSWVTEYFILCSVLLPFIMTLCSRLTFLVSLIAWRTIGRAFR